MNDHIRETMKMFEEELLKFYDEERRLRWFLSIRMDESYQRTLLEQYDSLNPDWIDAMQFGTSYEFPPLYREGYEPR